MAREEKIKGLYSLKEYLVANPIELEGHKSLPITLIDYAIEALEQEPNIKALGEEMRKVREGIKNEKVLIGFNMAVAICNKHLAEVRDKE